jgi:DNA-binding response OmpR family regulator
MPEADRRVTGRSDRRRVSRGGRRPGDQPGRYPPVLVVDTDAGARRAFVRYLNLHGFQVLEASTSDEALTAARRVRPHVVVSELLPTATARLASSVQAPMIVTATNFEESAPPYADALLIKPFPLPALLNEMRGALRARQTT